jgi:glycosyltransferase involved in cell wall biosynthesis
MLSVIVAIRIRDERFIDLWNLTMKSINGMLDTSDVDFELIVIDNGSHDSRYAGSIQQSSVIWDRVFTNVKGSRVLRFEEPISLAAAWNEGVNQSDGDFIMLANNDIVYHEKGWMSRMIEPFSAPDRKIGIVGIQHMSWYQFAFVEGSLYVFPATFKEEFDLSDPDDPVVRIFDERFTMSCEDVDFNRRVQDAGYKVMQVDNPPLQPLSLQHIGHQTVNTMLGTDEDYIKLSHENRVRLCEKYGIPPKITD